MIPDLIRQLVEIEQAGKVNDIKAGETLLWPLIRTMVWGRLSNPLIIPAEKKTLSGEARANYSHAHIEEQSWFPPNHSNRYVKKWLQLADNLRRNWRKIFEERDLQKLMGTEVLFWSRHHSYNDSFGGRYYNRHMDALLDFTRSRFSCAKIEVASKEGFRTLPRFEKTNFVTPPIRSSSIKPVKVTGYETLYKTALEIAGINLRDLNLQKLATTFFWRRQWFEHLLKIIQPKVVFMGGFFVSTEAALVSACRKLGIRTAECQHGRCGEMNAFYTHWFQIPKEGYEMMPDFFWTWGEITKQQIANGRTDNFSRLCPVVGGHRWLAKWKNGIPFKLEPAVENFLDHLKSFEKTILYSFTTLVEPLPDYVLKAMAASPKNWCWLLRIHPLMLADIAALETHLKNNGVSNFEIAMATTTPLFALLTTVQHHVTCSSSVAMEAAAFGVQTSIVSSMGRGIFENLIGNGLYFDAPDTESVLNQIRAPRSQNAAATAALYIETSDERANEALDLICNFNAAK